jgi:hypothetical protein
VIEVGQLMIGCDIEDLVGELYLLLPAQFVAARDELVRSALAEGNRELAQELRRFRRPTHSAWLVNLLARRDAAAMERLFALGRELRHAQAELDGQLLRRLSDQRKEQIRQLLHQARRHAADAGLEPTDAALAQVEATLHAALVDLAASFTVRTGRLIRPMSHSGFGPRPHLDVVAAAQERSSARAEPANDATGPWRMELVDDELAQRRQRQLTEDGEPRWPSDPDPRPELRAVPQLPRAGRPGAVRTVDDRLADGAERSVRRAEADLAAAQSVHWQRERDLADAETVAEAARERLAWLQAQYLQARRDRVTAEQELAEAQSQQRVAVRAVAEAHRRLDAAEAHPGRPTPEA